MGYLCEVYSGKAQSLKLYITSKENNTDGLRGTDKIEEFCRAIFAPINANSESCENISTKVTKLELKIEDQKKFESVFSFELLLAETERIVCPATDLLIYATIFNENSNYRNLCKSLIYEIPVIYIDAVIGVRLAAGRYHSNLSQEDLDNILIELIDEHEVSGNDDYQKPLIAPRNTDVNECVVAMILNDVKHTMNLMLNISNQFDSKGQTYIESLTVFELERYLTSLVSAGHMIRKSIDELKKVEQDEETLN